MNLSRIKWIGVVLLTSSTTFLFSQNEKNLGSYKKHSFNNGTLTIQTDQAYVSVEVINASCVHYRITEDAPSADFSYSVLPYASDKNIKWESSKAVLSASTSEIDIRISKSPLHLSIRDKKGKIIFENDSTFTTTWTGPEITTYNRLFPDERFIGLGEKTGGLDRRGNGYTNWNTDAFGYTPDTDPLYVSIPFYIGLHDSLCYGVYLDNTSKSHFNFGASNTRFSSFSVESGEMDYYIFYGKNVASIIEQYTALTGRTPMPAQWSLGFQQCRWSYYPDTEVLQIAETFRQKQIPLDVLYLDIHYMDAYKVFTWDKNKFPNPKATVGALKDMGVRTTLIIDPGIKVEKGYKAFEEGLSKNHFLKYPDGTWYEGSVWPGLCHFPDFTSPAAREWWGQSFQGYVNDGVMGFWNDMNEPATWGQRFPSNVQFNYDGHPTTTIESRNIFGMQMARATYEGTKKLMNKRPLVLTRAGFSGIQRYSAVWTGDNTANEDHMLLGVRLLNSLGLSGVANCGVDVGGFNGDASASLYTRWMTIGAFSPFYRAHKMINMKESEPWSYGEESEAIVKYYIQLRYKMMPYLYSTFYEATKTGMPVNRSLAIDHSFDWRTYSGAYQNQYYFGESFLIAPVSSTQQSTKVFLPVGEWYDFHNDVKHQGDQVEWVESPLYRLPIFVKAGAIVPMQKVVQSFNEPAGDTLFIHVYKGDVVNSFVYYEDDGESYAFEKGEYFQQEIIYDGKKNEISFGKESGSRPSKFKVKTIVLHGFEKGKLPKVDGNILTFNPVMDTMLFPAALYSNELYYAPKEEVRVFKN